MESKNLADSIVFKEERQHEKNYIPITYQQLFCALEAYAGKNVLANALATFSSEELNNPEVAIREYKSGKRAYCRLVEYPSQLYTLITKINRELEATFHRSNDKNAEGRFQRLIYCLMLYGVFSEEFPFEETCVVQIDEMLRRICQDLMERIRPSNALPSYHNDAEGSGFEGKSFFEELKEADGTVLTKPLKVFQRKRDRRRDRYHPYYSRIPAQYLGKRMKGDFPYREIIGSAISGVEEFDETKNLIAEYEADLAIDLKGQIPDYEIRLELEYTLMRRQDYKPESMPSALWIKEIICTEKEVKNKDSYTMILRFYRGNYYEHRLYQKILQEDGNPERAKFERDLKISKGNINWLKDPRWGICYSGVWIQTTDHYLVLSYHLVNDTGAGSGRLSYSSSGVLFCHEGENETILRDNLTMIVSEDIGIPEKRISWSDLKLFNVGINIDRCCFQMSYYWKCPYSSEDIRKLTVLSKGRKGKILFFLPMDSETISLFLSECEFDAGAAFSLLRLWQKNETRF